MNRDQSFEGPRRILALSGGGVRGVIEVAFLEAIEAAYRRRFGPDVRLCDVFDLVGGTSTGALIATSVSLGHPMSQIRDFYLTRAVEFFSRKRWWRYGRAPVFDCAALEAEIRADVGDMTLGDARIQTLLAIIIKRLDTGKPWIVNNIPSAPFFDHSDDGEFLGSKSFELAKLLRASTAAPLFFSQQEIALARDGAHGVFVDGGLTPYNDPSMALLKLARMKAFGLNWPLGEQEMFVVSLGSGRFRTRMDAREAARNSPMTVLLQAMRGLIVDAEEHSLMMMEWMGSSAAPSRINGEVGDLSQDWLTEAPLFKFLRLDLPLEPGGALGLSRRASRRFGSIDDPKIIAPLYELARDYCARQWDLDDLLI